MIVRNTMILLLCAVTAAPLSGQGLIAGRVEFRGDTIGPEIARVLVRADGIADEVMVRMPQGYFSFCLAENRPVRVQAFGLQSDWVSERVTVTPPDTIVILVMRRAPQFASAPYGAAGGIHVEKATFADSVMGMEPRPGVGCHAAQCVYTVNDRVGGIYLWAELRGGRNRSVNVIWYWQDREVARASAQVHDERVTIWSWQAIRSQQTGRWRAEIVADDGTLLAERFLDIKPDQVGPMVSSSLPVVQSGRAGDRVTCKPEAR